MERPHRKCAFVIATFLAALPTVGCVHVLGIEEYVVDDDAALAAWDVVLPDLDLPDADFGPVHEAGAISEAASDATGAASDATDAASDGVAPDAATDVGDAKGPGVEAGCAIVVPGESVAIFVAKTGVDGATCGGRSAPCQSIARALSRARTTGRSTLVLGPGTYREAVALQAGIRLLGGVGPGFEADCSAQASSLVTVQAESATTIIADALGGAATLERLTVRTRPSPAAGESVVGVFARGPSSSLVLRDVRILAGSAGDGSNGKNGGAGLEATGTCTPGDGASGKSGAVGAGAGDGLFGSNGYVRADGSNGSIGAKGGHGVRGGAASCVDCFACVSKTCTAIPRDRSCGESGASGCGGAGGDGGLGGMGGGSSVALFSWDASVLVEGGAIQAGDGGNGGGGGQGGSGGGGSLGAAGNDGPACTITCSLQAASCRETSGHGTGGIAGGAGGRGGDGGRGGAGAGGWSVGIVRGGNAVVTTSASTTISVGRAGAGARAGRAVARWP
jgi:hypothetical protein